MIVVLAQQVVEVVAQPRLMVFVVALVGLCAAALVVGRAGRTNP